MPSQRILVTPRSLTRSGHPALARLAEAGYQVVYCTPGQQPEEEELLRLLPGCAGYLAGVEKVMRTSLGRAAGVAGHQPQRDGREQHRLRAQPRLNIAVCRAVRRQCAWRCRTDDRPDAGPGATHSLVRSPNEGRTLGASRRNRAWRPVLGFGGMWPDWATRGGNGDCLGHARRRLRPLPGSGAGPHERFHFATSLQEVLREADVLSLHCPPPDDGRPLLTRERIALLKQGAYLSTRCGGNFSTTTPCWKLWTAGSSRGPPSTRIARNRPATIPSCGTRTQSPFPTSAGFPRRVSQGRSKPRWRTCCRRWRKARKDKLPELYPAHSVWAAQNRWNPHPCSAEPAGRFCSAQKYGKSFGPKAQPFIQRRAKPW